MKKLSLFSSLFFLSMICQSQKLKDISWYFSHYASAEGMNVFKIGKHRLCFNEQTVFLDNMPLIHKDSSSFFFLEVYSKKALIISYYPISQSAVSTGPQFRPKQKVEFILLSDPSQRWLFDLKGMFNSESITEFNITTGGLVLTRKIQGKKVDDL